MENKNILKKLNIIASGIDRLRKDGSNDFQKYKYASEKIIKEEFHKRFVENGIVFRVNIIDVTFHTLEKSVITIIKVEYSFIDSTSGESLSGTFFGSARGDDKGVYIALTGAIKYILTSNFLIPTGDDPEKDTKPKITPKIISTVTENDKKPLNPKYTEYHNKKYKCPSCQSVLTYKENKYGHGFFSCKNYPECSYSIDISRIIKIQEDRLKKIEEMRIDKNNLTDEILKS